MSKNLDETTERMLSQYLTDVRSLPNEAGKTVRFIGLVGSLFPGSAVITRISGGIEKAVKIELSDRTKFGRIDSYFGNSVIEFEQSLKATGTVAEAQLTEYCAGVWAAEGLPYRRLVAIASDGVQWRTYRPSLPPDLARKPRAEDVTLERLREFTLSETTLGDFYIWLNGLLFRAGQIVPSADQFQQDFGRDSWAYSDALASLRSAWRRVRREPEPALAFLNWQRYLTVTYGSLPKSGDEDQDATEISDIEELFLKHTYLASIARLMIWASLSKGESTESYREIAHGVLCGEYFRARGLANLVEEDFFQWIRSGEAERICEQIWERVVAQIETYDLSRLDQDVLKTVYQELVDPKDRHDLGEYYTPDWLCERIVAELLPKRGYVKTLDPTCGSGGFLRAAITHFLRCDPGAPDDVRLQSILEHVVGIDVHPLAVTIAKATYILALGRLVKAARRPIQIPVYMADSLFLPTEVKQPKLGALPTFEMRFGGKKVLMPESLIASPDLFDSAIAHCLDVAVAQAETASETAGTLSSRLLQSIPALRTHADHDSILESLWEFTRSLATLIRERKNSIWAFILRNSYRPAMLRKKFDVVIGNPPWLSYRYIADPEYQEEIKRRAVDEYRIAPRDQKLFTQMELATVFVAHSMGWFGKPGSRLGFVMPRSILSADQHENLRNRNYGWRCSFRISGYWDLWGVKPLFNVPACVLFTENTAEFGAAGDPVPVKEWSGTLTARDASWAAAKDQLSSRDAEARVIYLARRSAFSTEPGGTKPGRSGDYASRFRQGATILPRSLFFVRPRELPEPFCADGLYWAETDPDQAEEAKPPYRDVFMKGHVEGNFFFCTALSRHLLPFAVLKPATIVVPVIQSQGRLQVMEADELRRRGYRDFAKWMEKAEQIWAAKRGAKSSRQSIYEWLDYQGKLTAQSLKGNSVVVYNAAGTNISAAAFQRSDFPLPFLVEHKLYWAAFDTQREADYLAAVLNCTTVNEAIKPFQSVGLMGARDIEKKILDVAIPKYDGKKTKHTDLAALGREARRKTAGLIQLPGFPSRLAQQRAWVRETLCDVLAEVDRIVKSIL
ncbi:MAG: Eco57I restriction-modification methylase domain-containing protein [Bryobacteraceae bacterium]